MVNRFARNSLFGIVSGFSSALNNFATSVILARILGVDGLGTVMFAVWVMVLGSAFADLGSAVALSRYLPELESSGRPELFGPLTRNLFRPFALVLSVVCLAVVLYAAWTWHLHGHSTAETIVTDPRRSPAFWLLTAAALGLQTVSLFGYGYLRGAQRFGEIAVLTVVCLVIQIAAVAAGSLTYGVMGALAGYCAGFAVPAILTFRYLRGSGGIGRDLERRVRRYAAFAWAGNLATAVLFSRVEVFFLERSWGTEAVGLFAVGVTLANIASQGPMLLTSGLLPHFAESHGRADHASIQRLYMASTRVLAFLIFPACLGLAAILPSLLPLVYGSQFDPAVTASMILAFSSAGGVFYVASQLALGVDRSDLSFTATVIAAVLLLAGCVVVIPTYGIVGAAIVRAVVQVFLVVLHIDLIRRYLGFQAPIGHLLRLLLAAVLCGGAAWLATVLIPKPVNLVVAIPVGAAVYVLAVRLLDALPSEDIVRLRDLFSRLPAVIVRPLDWVLSRLSRDVAGPTQREANP